MLPSRGGVICHHLPTKGLRSNRTAFASCLTYFHYTIHIGKIKGVTLMFFYFVLSSYLSRTYGNLGAGPISEKPDISTCNPIASALLTCNPIAYGIIGIFLNLISLFEILTGLLPNFAGVQIAVAKLPPLSFRDFAKLEPLPFLVVVLFFCHSSPDLTPCTLGRSYFQISNHCQGFQESQLPLEIFSLEKFPCTQQRPLYFPSLLVPFGIASLLLQSCEISHSPFG